MTELLYRRAFKVILVILSAPLAFLAMFLSPASIGGGLNNLLVALSLISLSLLPVTFLTYYRFGKWIEAISSSQTKSLTDLRPGFNLLRTNLSSKNPVMSPVSGKQAALSKMTVEHFGQGSVIAEEHILQNSLELGNSRDKISFAVNESADLRTIGAEKTVKLVQGIESSNQRLKQFEDKHNIKLTGVPTNFVEENIGNNEEVTIAGNFEQGKNAIELSSTDKLPAIISPKSPDKLAKYLKDKKRNRLLMISLFATTAAISWFYTL